MARSILENPNFSWATWNPTTWTDPVEDTTTEDVVTPSGLTSMYPYLPMGGGTGGVEGTPLIPRPDASTPGYSLANDPLDPFFMQRPSDPNLLTRGVNWLTKRPTATESFAGGEGGIGSLAGVTMGEKGLLNELLAGGFLVNTPGGLKTTSGKNVVSMFGGYEEGQEEAYQNYLDEYGGLTGIQKAIATGRLKGAKLKRYNESKVIYSYLNQQKVNMKKAQENVIKKIIEDKKIIPPVEGIGRMPTAPAGGMEGVVWGPQKYLQPPIQDPDTGSAQIAGKIAAENRATKRAAVQEAVSQQIGASRGNGGGQSGTGAGGLGAPGGGGYGPWKAKGGLIRKQYGNGGIVDLL